MLGVRMPHDLTVSLGTAMNDVITDARLLDHSEIMHHREGFDFIVIKKQKRS